MRRLKIIYDSVLPVHLARLGSVAETIGVTPEYVPLAASDCLASALEEMPADTDLILDVASLSKMSKQDDLGRAASIVRTRSLSILLLTISPDERSSRFVEILSAGTVRGVQRISASTTISFEDTASKSAGELASYSYARKQGTALVLNVPDETGIEILMKLDNAPALVRLSLGSATMFVWSTPEIFDVMRPLAAELEFEQAADEYIPAIIFLRLTFGQQCWTNPRNGTGIVIDDPLLKKTYGFLKFPQLLESGRKHGYHITLAFIPWNHWRSRPSEAHLFRRYSDCFSICAHGCDHTNREFKSTDYDVLLEKTFIARRRIDQLSQRTGIPSDPLMVCPQEQYSLEAMQAFADSRQFLGLVCTACMPRNLSTPQLRGADLLLPAQDSFFGVPVFKRHYWRDMSVFAMALFLGKPAILVEHHEFFKDGPGGVDAFVSGLAKLRPDIKWTSLTEMATRTHLKRQLSNDHYELRFFTDTFRFEHDASTPIRYRFKRRIPSDTLVAGMTLNGKSVPFSRENGVLTCDAEIERSQQVTIELAIPPRRSTHPKHFGLKYKTEVAIRRGLSEFRDNVIAKNDSALRFSRRMARRLRQTVDST